MIPSKQLGQTSLKISTIGLGSIAFGGHYGPVARKQVTRTIRAAVDAGVTFFDTSPSYGAGLAEELLAEALIAEEVTIATKVGGGIDSAGSFWFINSKTNILQQVEESLRRLRRDQIDLYLLQGPDNQTPIGETMDTLEHLRATGRIRYIGLGNPTVEVLLEALKHTRVDVVEIPYNILNRSSEMELLPFCRAARIGVLTCEPFCRGLLTGQMSITSAFDEEDLRTSDPLFRGDVFRRNIENVNRLHAYAHEQGLTMVQLALGWILQNPVVGTAVCGAKAPDQIGAAAGSAQVRLTPEQFIAVTEIIGEHSFHPRSMTT